MLKKKIKTRNTDEVIELESALETWMVYWYKFSMSWASGRRHPDNERASQAFINKEEALRFIKSLKDGWSLSGSDLELLDVELKKQNNGIQ